MGCVARVAILTSRPRNDRNATFTYGITGVTFSCNSSSRNYFRGKDTVATYTYRCRECGEFDLTLPMGTAQPVAQCHSCHKTSERIFTSPALQRSASPLRRARELSEASASEPALSRQPPDVFRPQKTAKHPLHELLPRS